jgi:lipoprotein-anchoring transpeptidase ErfK/SrfK
MRTHLLLALWLATLVPSLAQDEELQTADAVATSTLDVLIGRAVPVDAVSSDIAPAEPPAPKHSEPAVTRLQVRLDQGGASPGVIDGFDGENVRKAVAAFEALKGLPVDGVVDPEVIRMLETEAPVLVRHVITSSDLEGVVGPLPEDYAELAQFEHLGFASAAEALAEQFHMDIDFLKTLNPDSSFEEGEEVVVAAVGDPMEGKVTRIEADKRLGQLRAYDATNRLLVAYPATVGSEDNPSPAGIHTVTAVAPEPTYTYNPEVNFQQGDNTEVLELAAGPNNPVGSTWIDLSEPTYGIHGTPEPSRIDKAASHGCVRLTNWDAEELAGMVEQGVTVEFIQ